MAAIILFENCSSNIGFKLNIISIFFFVIGVKPLLRTIVLNVPTYRTYRL